MSEAATKLREDAYPSRSGRESGMTERRDRIVHGEWYPGAPLTEAETDRYQRDGFLKMDGLLQEEELEALKAELARLRRAVGEIDAELVIAEPGDSTLRSIFRVHEISEIFGRLARDSRLVKVAEYLLGDRVYVHQSRLNYKPGFVGKEFYWHSDFETWHVEDGMPRMRALSVSISLLKNTEHNGPLMLIPGSHRYFVRCLGETPDAHYRQSLRKQEYGVPDGASLRWLVGRGGISSATGEAGTTVFFDCNTMHGSNGNITPHPRSNVFIVYNSVHNAVEVPYGPQKPRPGFLAERDDFRPVTAVSGPIRARED